MPIVMVRVDNRLIHGQILESWVPVIRAQELVVANDALAGDHVQRMIMQAATPYSIDLVMDSVDRIASLLRNSDKTDVRRMVIVDDPVDALRLKRGGVEFDQLNLGNLATREVVVNLSHTVSVGGESLRALRVFLQEGVRVMVQAVPFEKPVDLYDVCPCTRKA